MIYAQLWASLAWAMAARAELPHPSATLPPATKPAQETQALPDLNTDPKDLPQFSASKERMSTPPCPHALTGDKVLAYLRRPVGNPALDAIESRSSRGFAFSSEPKWLLDAFDALVTPEAKDAAAPKFSSECTRVMCAAKEIFGETLGPKLIYMAKKYGFNGSHLAFSGSAAWTEDELDDVLAALEQFPDGALPKGRNVRLTHYERGARARIDPEDALAASSGDLDFYDLWSKQTSALRRYVVFHELAHFLGRKKKLQSSSAWEKLGGWELKAGGSILFPDYECRQPLCLVSKYARTSPREDFAESAAAYRYAPEWLKARCPAKYEYLKAQAFGGKEYLPGPGCRADRGL